MSAAITRLQAAALVVALVGFTRLVDAVAVATGGNANDGGRPLAAAVTATWAVLALGLAAALWRQRRWAVIAGLAMFAAGTAISLGAWSPTSFGLNLGVLAVVLWASLAGRARTAPADIV